MNNIDVSKTDKYEDLDVDLFKISYLLWKGKILLSSLLIVCTLAAYGIYKFQDFQKIVYVDLTPNTESMPFLSKLDKFDIKSQNIFRIFLTNLNDPTNLKNSLKKIYPNDDESTTNNKLEKILNQLRLTAVYDEISKTFDADADDLKYKTFRLSYNTYDNLDDAILVLDSIVSSNLEFFQNKFLETVKLKRYDILNKNALVIKNRIKEIDSKIIETKEQIEREKSSYLSQLYLNLDIAKNLNIEDPYLDKGIALSNFITGLDSSMIQSRIYLLGFKFLENEIMTIEENDSFTSYTSERLNALLSEKLSLASFNDFVSEDDDIILLNDAQILEERLSDAEFKIVKYDYRSIKVDTETQVYLYVSLGAIIGFLLGSIIIFFENARVSRNLPL